MDFKRTLRQKIQDGGLDPDAKPEMTSKYITGTLNKKVAGLQSSYEDGSNPRCRANPFAC